MTVKLTPTSAWFWLAALCLLTALVYSLGLSGGWLFDDYPNIVENTALHIHHFSIPDLVGAALSSPSSEFKRPLASLTLALNYLATGLDPYWMKLTNVAIHLVNGVLVFVLARQLLVLDQQHLPGTRTQAPRTLLTALLIAGGWMLLPINLTAVLYVVQRMESLANVFVLAGLIGYVAGRRRMLSGARWPGFTLAAASLVLGTAVGVTAKETAVMLPLYAFVVEWIAFRGRRAGGRREPAIWVLFTLVLFLPMVAGLAWQLPRVLSAGDWSTRNFTLGQRLLTESRVVIDYVVWTLLPTPHALSFYHDDFTVSKGLLQPWTTLPCLLLIGVLVGAVFALRRRHPRVALGLGLFLGCQLLTATVLPLELVYEHRNYFASFGLLLAVVPWLTRHARHADTRGPSFSLARGVALVGLLLLWTGLTALTTHEWGNPLTLAQSLAERAPDSPRAQYGLGRTYIIYSQYKPDSVFTQMAYAPLERAMRLPDASILPEQALIFFNARLHRPLKASWWNAMIAHLKAKRPGVQDVSSLQALTKCARDGFCNLPKERMVDAFLAALSHPHPGARLLAIYGDYAWNVLGDHGLALRVLEQAVATDPSEPAYRITLTRMFAAEGLEPAARAQLQALEHLNVGGRLDSTIANLRSRVKATDIQ